MTTTGKPKALTYAEGTLGVHKVYEDLLEIRARLSEARERVIVARKEKHDAEQLYLDAEYDFVTTARADMADMSQTAFDKHIKVAIHNHPKLRPMRAELAQRGTNIEFLEASMSNMRTDIEIGVARLTELGGYLAYLAAVKEADTAMKYPRHPEDWPPASAVAGATTPATPATPTTPAN